MFPTKKTHLKMPKLPEKYESYRQCYYQWSLHQHGGGVHDVHPSGGNLGSHDAQQASSLAEANPCNMKFEGLNRNTRTIITDYYYLNFRHTICGEQFIITKIYQKH